VSGALAEPNAGTGRSSLRSLEVFEAFRQARRPLSLSELARLTDMPVSTCHGVMRALEQRGYLYFVGARDAYPTRKLWDSADEIRAHDPVERLLEPGLAALRDETDETVILGTRQADAVLYLLVLESGQSIRYSARAGERKPLHSSAIGKVLLGGLSPEALDQWLSRRHLERVTDRTLTGARQLRADLDASRARGWYATRGENVADVMAVAAPLRLGSSVFGVAIAGPLHRMQAAEAKHAKRLLQCVRRLEDADGR
jgi:DNA-binding IclR family transcriptional regulator